MPADSTIVKTATENVSNSHGILDVLVEWWWVIILLAIIACIGYVKNKWVLEFYRKLYINLLIKMDKIKIIYDRWDTLLNKGRFEQLIKECDEADKNIEISGEDRVKINDYREKAKNAKEYNEIIKLLKEIENKVKNNLLLDATAQIEKVNGLLRIYSGKERPTLINRIGEIENQIKTKKIEQFEKKIREAIDKKEYDSLIQAFSMNYITVEGLSKKEISPIIAFVKTTWQRLIDTCVKDGVIDNAINLFNYSLKFDVLKDDEFVGEIKDGLVMEIEQLIADKIKNYLPSEAKSIRDHYADFLPSSILREINRSIEICENSKPAKIKDYINKSKDAAQKGLFQDAWEEYRKAVNLNGAEFIDAKNEIELLEKENQIRINKQKYNEIIDKIKQKIENGNWKTASEFIQQAEQIDVEDKSKLKELSEEIFKMQKADEEENKLFRNEAIVLAKCKGQDYFNVPKKKEHGEDADPYVNVNSGRIWGLISVFDGMGGAGARKYKHATTGEEHTSAWWASRYVKEAVEDLMSARPKGENPISYLENNLKNAIVTKLNVVVKNFPAANAPLLSKMMRKLPTTMALCTYFIEDKNLTITCFWSGDSRIYMFDKSKMYFLTKDDADALEGDPFSPANMDLAMNNTICQDRDFRINKSKITVTYSSDNPVVLIAATDGCFGYFKNPIEFEYTIRHSLSTSKILEEWLPSIKDAIIENIQQDDFSMALVEIGENSFSMFKDKLTTSLSNELFEDYYSWKNSNKQKQEKLLSDIAEVDQKVLSCKENIDMKKNDIEKIKEDIVKSAVLSEYEGYDSFKQNILNKKNAITEELEQLGGTIEMLSNKRKFLKETLDSIQLQTDSQNNEWYAKYKETFEIVNPVDTIK